ncbi:COG1361 S-layer family protein [Halarchaeum salinum]|uniref:Sialidase n=1 Tax=Halarchaeum salinum TaxID=489912 RepID=A0AAV3S8V6_9EURY
MQHERYITSAVIALLLLSAAPLTASALQTNNTVAGHPDLHASVVDNEFTTGTEATLDLYVQNDGVITQGGNANYQERVKTARATKLSVSGGDSPITVHTKQYPAGDIGDGVNGPYGIDITVPEDAEPGTYHLTVHASYTYTAAVRYGPSQPRYTDYTRDVTFDVPVVVRDRAQFQVVNHSTDARINQRGTYSVSIKNVGSEVATNADVKVSSQTQAVTFGSSGRSASASVDRWEPGETKTLTYDTAVDDIADVHNYSVPVDITFADADGVTRQSNRLLTTFRPRPEQTFAIDDIESTLRIGRGDGTLTGTVTNTGPEPIHDATLAVANNDSAFSFDQRAVSLPDLDAGESGSFSFDGGTVPKTANVSSLPVELAVHYDNEQDDTYTSDVHEVHAAVGPYKSIFDITAVNKIPAGTRGDTPKDSDWSELTFQVTNNGDTTLHNIKPSIVFDSQYFERPIESNYRTSVIGTLEPGESTNVTYAVSAAGVAGGTTYPLDVVVNYDRPNGVTRTTTSYTVPVSISPSSSLPLLPIGGGAIILIGILLGAFIWKRRSPDEAE